MSVTKTSMSLVLNLVFVLSVADICRAEPPPCGKLASATPDFVHCLATLVPNEADAQTIANTILGDPLRGYLEILSSTIGYRASDDDITTLKRWSLALKEHHTAYWDAIGVIDDAVASHADEVRPVMSIRELASAVDKPGENIYPLFITKRLEFLNSRKPEFYNKGPFELQMRGSVATTLESSFFLEYSRGNSDLTKIRKEVEILDAVYDKLRGAEVEYVNLQQNEVRKSSNRFWRASLLFLLGDKERFTETLRGMVIEKTNIRSILKEHRTCVCIQNI